MAEEPNQRCAQSSDGRNQREQPHKPFVGPYGPASLALGAAQPCSPMSLALGQPCLPHSSHPSIALRRAGADGDDDDDGGNAALQGSLLPPAAEARLWEGGQMPPGTLEQ